MHSPDDVGVGSDAGPDVLLFWVFAPSGTAASSPPAGRLFGRQSQDGDFARDFLEIRGRAIMLTLASLGIRRRSVSRLG